MSKNTGDGELDGLITTFIMQYDQKVKIGNKRNLEAVERHKTAIKKYTAQEANKAREGEINHFLDLFSTALLPHQIRYLRQRLAQLTKEKESSVNFDGSNPGSPNTNIDAILDKLEKAFTYYHKSHDASAGTAKIEAKTQLQALLSAAYNQGLEDADKPVYLPPPKSTPAKE